MTNETPVEILDSIPTPNASKAKFAVIGGAAVAVAAGVALVARKVRKGKDEPLIPDVDLVVKD